MNSEFEKVDVNDGNDDNDGNVVNVGNVKFEEPFQNTGAQAVVVPYLVPQRALRTFSGKKKPGLY
jgi:hypothetical protein